MKTFLGICLKVLLVVALGIVIIHVWPLAIVPLVIGLLLVLGLGVLLLTGLVAVGATGLGVVIGLLALAIVLLALFSPVWIPVAVILGIVWLVKKLARARHRPAATT
ncbi:MAG: hypothetical protein ABSG50_03095 [Opitutaceae bacterium]|jgi:hypothetical protein